MRRLLINYVTLVAATLAALLYVGCNDDDSPSTGVGDAPRLQITTTKLSVGGEGGGYVVDYTVLNARKGVMPTVEVLSDWITDVEVTPMQICFNVAPSDIREERTTRLKIEYEGAESSHIIYITQAEMVLNLFDITLPQLTPDTFTVEWTPADENMLYIPNLIAVDYFTVSGVDTEEQFITEEFNYFISVAQSGNITLEELLLNANKAIRGAASNTYAGLMPGSRYLAYCYGVSLDGNNYEITTPLHYKVVNIPMPELRDAVFNISAESVGSKMRVTIKPDTWAGYYVMQVIPSSSMYYISPGDDLNMLSVRAMHSTFFDQVKNYTSKGGDVETFLRTSCYSGEKSVSLDLQPGNYMLAVFGVSANDGYLPMMRTMPQTYHFSI